MMIFYYSIHPRYKTELLFLRYCLQLVYLVVLPLSSARLCQHPNIFLVDLVKLWTMEQSIPECMSAAHSPVWTMLLLPTRLKFQFWLVSPWWGSQLSPTVQRTNDISENSYIKSWGCFQALHISTRVSSCLWWRILFWGKSLKKLDWSNHGIKLVVIFRLPQHSLTIFCGFSLSS